MFIRVLIAYLRQRQSFARALIGANRGQQHMRGRMYMACTNCKAASEPLSPDWLRVEIGGFVPHAVIPNDAKLLVARLEELPHFTYRLLPLAVGVPLIVSRSVVASPGPANAFNELSPHRVYPRPASPAMSARRPENGSRFR